MSQNTSDDNPILAAWQQQLQHASKNPFLFQLLLKQWQRVLKRLAYFYAQLASLPRRNRRALQRALATSLIGVAMLLALSSAPVVHAASITVSGACTLDEAITNANDDAATFPDCAAGSGADTIYLTADVTLAGYLPYIASEITLEGNNYFVSGANSFQVFYVNSTGDFTINDTTVKEGIASYGGGIFNYHGTLEVNNSTVSGNSAAATGGGIFSQYGTVTLNNSTVSGNSANGFGGGIYNRLSGLYLNNSTVSGNSANFRAGGISNVSGLAILTKSTVSGNNASDNGGGIANIGGGTLELNNSTVSGNSAGGNGGGAWNDASLILNNSTVSDNDASFQGGGITNYDYLYFHRSLISGNTAVYGANEILNYDVITANDYNLFGHSGETNAQAFGFLTPGATDITATSDGTTPTALTDILDTTLALNGGTTENHALVTDSPALDKAPNTECSAKPIFDVDQRDFPRNVDIVPPSTANDCDIGAYELQNATAINVAGFRAKVQADKIILKWRTTTESQIAGFNVWRKNDKAEWKQINANFKQAKHSGDAQGSKYRFHDNKVKAGNTYRYKIEVKYLDGHTEFTDVVKVETP